jgi:hypothetical protein
MSKNISSMVVFDDMDELNECTELHGADLSVEAVLSSGLYMIDSLYVPFLGASGSGFIKPKVSCIGESRAGDVADRFS